MTSTSTTIRVSTNQRERLRQLAAARHSSMSDTLDAALESLRRDLFYSQMADAEGALRASSEWEAFADERNEWMNADLA